MPKGAETAAGYINITPDTQIEIDSPTEFSLVAQHRQYKMQAKTKEEAAEWFRKLMSAKDLAEASSRA